MEKIRVLLAEDTKTDRERYKREIVNYPNVETKYAENAQKAIQYLLQSEKESQYYDVLFADIDFTESKGGQRDEGYKIIKKAFEICPITKIYTYSNQSTEPDLLPQTEEAYREGLIVRSFDKRKNEGTEWFKTNFESILLELNEDSFLWDIWSNHQIVAEKIKKITFSRDTGENLQIQYSIISNLESIIAILRNYKQYNSEVIFFRLFIHLYHNALEVFCGGAKTTDEIFEQSEANREKATDLLGLEVRFFERKDSAYRKIVAYSAVEILKYGDKVNLYRNKSLHPSKEFLPTLANVVYTNLALTLYVCGKEIVNFRKIKNTFTAKTGVNRVDTHLKDFINYLEK